MGKDEPLKREDLKIGGNYNWKNQPERLVYLGKHHDDSACRGWFPFAKIAAPHKVWCEVRAEDLESFEVTLRANPK